MQKGLLFLVILILLVPAIYAEAPWPMFQGNQRHTGLSPYGTSHVNGAIKWTFETGDGIESSPTISDDGTIFFGSHDGYLYALNSDGTLKWKFKPAEPIYDEGGWKHYSAIISSPTIASDGTVYIIAPDDYFYAVKDGKEKWRFPLKWDAINFWTSAGIGTDGTIYVGSARPDAGDKLVAGFYALTPDGKEKWHYEISAGVTSAPAIAKDGTIYVNGNTLKKTADGAIAEGYLFAFAQDGKLKWKFKMQDWVETSPSVGDDGTIYTGSKEGKVYALNPDGTLKWAFSANDGIGGAPAIGKDGTIYVGSWDNNFYALNPDGSKKWSYEVEPGFETIGASAAIGSDGTIYFGTTKGFFYALNPDGTKKWKIANMASVASSPAIGKDGTIYIGSWDKKMYAISAGEAPTEKEIPEVCHATQLSREVKFEKEPANTCIEGACDSYSTICPKKGLDGKCAAPMEACISKNCKKYRSYCHLIAKDLEGRTGGNIIFKENYITADGQKHFIKEMKVFLSPKQERSIGWYYEVDADKLGYCDYSDLANPVCNAKVAKASGTLAPKRGDSSVPALAPCQSGGLTTSAYKDYQMMYPDEDFIRINDIDLLKDVSQLKDLTCLQYLDATDRTIKGDIANLNNLKNLEVFSLYSNPDVYGDICSLAGAANLRSLKFAFNPKITGDISCLKGLTNLETFAMTHTQIYGDLSVFANMPNLKAIYVSGTNVTGDICAFSKLANLEELGIADEYPGNPDITGDLSCLDNLQKLKRVSIYNTGTANCEQFTKTHPDLAKTVTESGKQGGGGCSKESLKTLVDYAQKYERKIGKEVQTEVRGKPDYNKPDVGRPEECFANGEFIGADKCRALIDKTSKGISASGEGKQLEEPDQRNFVTKFIDWIKGLFGWAPKRGIEATAGQSRQSEDKNQIRPQAGPGGCRSQAECDVFCSKPENQEECSKFEAPDEGPPEECTIDGKFIGEAQCKAMMEKTPGNALDGGPPQECTIDGKFIGEEKCKAMMEKTPGNALDGGPPQECIINGNFIGEEKCKAMMEKAPSGDEN